jgi:autotransporter-associated beta strand protein
MVSDTGGIAVADGATLSFNRADSFFYGGVISGGGNLYKTGAGKLTLTGANTHTGNTIVHDGTLVLDQNPIDNTEASYTIMYNATLLVTDGEGTIILSSGTNPAAPDTTIVLTAAPGIGYKVKEWTQNGLTVNGINIDYILYMGRSHTVTVAFEPICNDDATLTHVWGKWVVLTPLTLYSQGIKQRTCTVCHATETQYITTPGTHEDVIPLLGTAPISNENTTAVAYGNQPVANGRVPVDYRETRGNVALSIPTAKINELRRTAINGIIILDLSGIDNASAAVLPKDALAAFSEAGREVKIILPQGTIWMDAQALSDIASLAKWSNVLFSIAVSDAPTAVIRSGSENIRLRHISGMLDVTLP